MHATVACLVALGLQNGALCNARWEGTSSPQGMTAGTEGQEQGRPANVNPAIRHGLAGFGRGPTAGGKAAELPTATGPGESGCVSNRHGDAAPPFPPPAAVLTFMATASATRAGLGLEPSVTYFEMPQHGDVCLMEATGRGGKRSGL